MPSYEASASAMMYQFFPGETSAAGQEILGANGLKAPFVNPASFYSEPEWQQNREDAYFPTHTVPLRATLFLYHRTSQNNAFPMPDTSGNPVVVATGNWLDAVIYDFYSSIVGTTFTQDVSGGITPSGTLLKQTNKPLTGAVSSIVGTLAKQTNKPLSGALSSIVGTLTKQTNKPLSGAITSIVGTLITSFVYSKTVSGAITSIVGTLAKQANKTLSGGITPSGTLAKQTNKPLSGAITPAGTLAKQTNKALAGTLTSSGALSVARALTKSLSGAVASAGALVADFIAGVVLPLIGTDIKPKKKPTREQLERHEKFLEDYRTVEREREMKAVAILTQRLNESEQANRALAQTTLVLQKQHEANLKAEQEKLDRMKEILASSAPSSPQIASDPRVVASRMLNLEKAREARDANKQREAEVAKQRLKNLAKARKAKAKKNK